MASWLVSATLVINVPIYVSGLLSPGDARTAVSTLVFGVALGCLLLRGLPNGDITPCKLFLAPIGIAPVVQRGPSTDKGAPFATAPFEAWLGWAVAGSGAAFTMLRAELLVGALWQPLLVALALSLCAVGSRALWPWFDNRTVVLAVAGLNTAIVWWSFISLTDQSFESLLMTAVILATGALCIVLGFRLGVKPLRNYGLVLVMASVLKLAAYDITASDSAIRVLVLVCAGVVCFVLSLAYNRIASDEDDGALARRRAGSGPSGDGRQHEGATR
ncbi:MAG: hypothetical protein Q3979_10185 [Actinomycetaceae bacterium]|nr:hypothetical protein [Actinomycetaceae bacterium]